MCTQGTVVGIHDCLCACCLHVAFNVHAWLLLWVVLHAWYQYYSNLMYGGHVFTMSLLHNYGVTMMIDVLHGEPCKLRTYTLLLFYFQL